MLPGRLLSYLLLRGLLFLLEEEILAHLRLDFQLLRALANVLLTTLQETMSLSRQLLLLARYVQQFNLSLGRLSFLAHAIQFVIHAFDHILLFLNLTVELLHLLVV